MTRDPLIAPRPTSPGADLAQRRSVRQALARSKGWLKVTYERARSREIVHFLHIGKAGGTATKSALKKYSKMPNRRAFFVAHTHQVSLAMLPPGQRFVFSVRDPTRRFYSAFYDRRNRGHPWYQYIWSDGERFAFERFRHAVDLAEALDSADDQERRDAIRSMRTIGHVNSSYWNWFSDSQLLVDRVNDLVGVVHQESLISDLQVVFNRLDARVDAASLMPDRGSALGRPGDYDGAPLLSERAKQNLKVWYSQEFAFLELLEQLECIESTRSTDLRICV